jgi:hypothetical protein
MEVLVIFCQRFRFPFRKCCIRHYDSPMFHEDPFRSLHYELMRQDTLRIDNGLDLAWYELFVVGF